MNSTAPSDRIECRVDEGFADWMSKLPGFLAVTTYHAGKVVFIGWDGQRVTILPRHFDKPMGLALAPLGGCLTRLALATRHNVTIFADAPPLAPNLFPDRPGAYDALFLPRVSYHTGDLNIHDLAFVADKLWVVNTRFSCLARPSETYSFEPAWVPPFVSELVPEDRCHLNGLCVVDGVPHYVTCLGETDAVGGWRGNKASGGCVVDVRTAQVVVRGLSMPHSPRWHAGQLWVLNSGAGELLTIGPADGRTMVAAVLPGYLRGLSLVGSFAAVGMCQIREQHIFGGLPVQNRHRKLLCGVAVLDLRTGARVGLLEFTAGCTELFEVLVVPGSHRPMLMNAEREESRQAFSAPTFAYWLRPENLIQTISV